MTHPRLRISPLALCATLILAAQSADSQETDTARLETVVVSATRAPASSSSLTQQVTVITGEELRRLGVARVSDALRGVPGAALVQNGSFGAVNTLFMRGGESRYTKVLIDGVAVNAPGGFFDFSHLATDNIDRIEIVRGPSSVVHGADAVSGVIQIFTRRGTGAERINADVRAGTYGTRDAALDFSGGRSSLGYSFGASHRRTDGIYDFNNQYENGTLSALVSSTAHSGADAQVTARYASAEFHYPTDFTGAPVDSNAFRVQRRLTAAAEAGVPFLSFATARVRFGTNEVTDITDDIEIPFGATEPVHSRLESDGYRRSGEGWIALRLPLATTASFGAEHVKEREHGIATAGPVAGAATPTSSFSADRSNTAAYAELLGSPTSATSYTVAGRLDDNSDYGSFATYRAGVSLAVTRSLRLRVSIGTAFNAPAFNQIHPTLYTTGSPSLEPERTRSWEAGIEGTFVGGRALASATYFNQRFDDLIQYVPGGPPDFVGSFDNLATAESNGFELNTRLAIAAGLAATAAYTYARPRVTQLSSGYSGDLLVGQDLIRRPRRSANLGLQYASAGKGSLALAAQHVGKRPDLDFSQFPSPTVMLPAYTRIDLAGSAPLVGRDGSRTLDLTLRVENLLGTTYEDVLNFRAPGRVILIGARFGGTL